MLAVLFFVGVATINTCLRAEDPVIRGMAYDISSLQSSADYVMELFSIVYTVNVCQPVNIRGDPNSYYSCLDEQTGCCENRYGGANYHCGYPEGVLTIADESHWSWSGETVTLRYRSRYGSGNDLQFYFYCDPSIGVGYPTMREVRDYVIHSRWTTGFACLERFEGIDPCSEEDVSYDLTSLNQEYQIYDQGLVFNPCRPVSSSPCITDYHNYGCSTSNQLGLGTLSSQAVPGQEQLDVTYTGGSPCGSGQKHSLQVHYTCGKGYGPPVFNANHSNQCLTWIDFPTLLVCDENPVWDCLVSTNNNTYDLSALNREWRVRDPNDLVDFIINPCELLQMTECGKHSMICQDLTGRDLGFENVAAHMEDLVSVVQDSKNVKKQKQQTEQRVFALEYRGGSFCPTFGVYRSAVIEFSCGTDLGEPKFLGESFCLYRFEWVTNLVC
eukprot:Lithocolla_globosa_v1_NODE_625_length_3568_cov_66.349274.p2 type:complete len:441 gc:universal NODE_625_length_3568_cov_66.349274:1937-3259(+)